MTEETRPPYPGPMAGWSFRTYDDAMTGIVNKIITVITTPNGFLAVNTINFEPMGKIIAQRNVGPKSRQRKNER